MSVDLEKKKVSISMKTGENNRDSRDHRSSDGAGT